ncbi:MAG TPA: hypothetical protein VLA13_09430 [Massilibacterium sp.]|nr:hypothetical protein [Massilibacterium sp.]
MVDIRKSVDFSKISSLVVDTNAWFWTTYTGDFAPDDKPYGPAMVHYPNFLGNCLSENISLKYSTISLAELHKLTEVSLYKLYKSWIEDDQITFKNYRFEEPAQRKDFLEEFESMYSQINTMADHLPTFDHVGEKYIGRLVKASLEEYLEIADLVIIKSAESINITDFITDDGDFATMEGITVYTANNKVVEAAKNNGLLLN